MAFLKTQERTKERLVVFHRLFTHADVCVRRPRSAATAACGCEPHTPLTAGRHTLVSEGIWSGPRRAGALRAQDSVASQHYTCPYCCKVGQTEIKTYWCKNKVLKYMQRLLMESCIQLLLLIKKKTNDCQAVRSPQ